MRTGVRSGCKRRSTGNRHVHMKSVESEDSDDEDYVAEVETDDQSDELDSLVGDASEEISCFEADEEEGEGGLRRVVKTRSRKGSARYRNNDMKRPKKKRIKSNDDDDYDDDEDEEFTSEEEYLEEEGYCLLEAKNGKRKSTMLKKSKSVERKRIKSGTQGFQKNNTIHNQPHPTGATSHPARSPYAPKEAYQRRHLQQRKPCTKRNKNLISLSQRKKSHGEKDSVKRGPTTLRGGNTKKPIREKKLVTAGSKSNIRSDSSDYEFTISNEEQEQIREANMIYGSVATNSRSSRIIQKDEAICGPKTPSTRKGKEKEEVIKKDMSKLICGICLSEEGKNIVRGMLNCCSHYFCFSCIFEWSKVETRCPLCKQRFVSISKPTRCSKGFELRNTIIPVLERDQIYQPSEEELRDILNPYENVICTECHHGGDDALMLLCDICDSPAHTYCVGLGREVPEGNWYCNGCRLATLGSSHSQTQEFTPDHSLSIGVSDGISTFENMAQIDLNVTIPESPVSQVYGLLSSPRFSGVSSQTPLPISGVGVSTVSGRRFIHRQIQHILTSRLNQIAPEADTSSMENFIGWGVNITQQQIRTIELGPSHHAQYVDRLQDNPYISAQNWNYFPERLGHMMRHIDQSTTFQNGLVQSQIHWSGLENLNMGSGQSQRVADEQLHPCNSRSSTWPEIGTSLSYSRYEEHANFVKQQVYSTVRSQMMSFSQDMTLGRDDYVEICRRSAQTIMVAYGLEPRRHDTYMAYAPICFHIESRLANVEASPINGCCLACFEAFVKDVVKRIMAIIIQPRWLGFRT